MTTRFFHVALATGLLGIVGCGGAVTAPTSYDAYEKPNEVFQCESPSGWKVEGGGKKSFAWAKFTSGPATIKVESSVTDSLFGDIGESGGMGLGIDEFVGEEDAEELDLAPVAKVHAMGIEAMEEKFSDYQETSTEKVQSGLGEGRVSEFTASGSFGGKVRGIRATFLGHNHGVRVLCQVPEKQFDTAQPAFQHVIESLKSGK